jgi:hypothetical protein
MLDKLRFAEFFHLDTLIGKPTPATFVGQAKIYKN